jgi:aminopeptidase N
MVFSRFLWFLPVVAGLFTQCARTTIPAPEEDFSETRTEPSKTAVSESGEAEPAVAKAGWRIPGNPERYRAPRSWDLTHQQLEIRPRFSDKAILGRTILYVKPLLNPLEPLIIDAKNIEIQEISSIPKGVIDHFGYDSAAVHIDFKKSLVREQDSIGVVITYTAYPPSLTGLHFVDPTGVDSELPTQIWTLGQPEDNSWWVPTIDRPDERITHELFLALPDSMTAFSNGVKLYARKNPGDSLTTHYWRMDKAHSPYLIAFAAGNFSTETVLQGNVRLTYAVEPVFKRRASAIYGVTGPALSYFESVLGMPYPWPAYTQVAVREFAAGGMENTGCTILFDGVQNDSRADADFDHQDLIVHELAHQWFGNAVTCEDWPHLTIQEGMVTFFEFRYRQQTHGINRMKIQIIENREEYFDQAEMVRHPLVFKNYEDPYDVFDAHTYNKGGQVFWMLYNLIGEEAFFKGLRMYLNAYSGKTATIEDVQLMMEQASGNSLERFFRQWMYGAGHPEIETSWEATKNGAAVTLKQVQDKIRQPVFELVTSMDVYTLDGQCETIPLHWRGNDTTIAIQTGKKKITDILFDPESILLAVLKESSLQENAIISRLKNPDPIIRFRTMKMIENEENPPSEAVLTLLKTIAAKDTESFNRQRAFELLEPFLQDESVRLLALKTANGAEKSSGVRLAALRLLALDTSAPARSLRETALRDTSYLVASEAMLQTARLNPQSIPSLKSLASQSGYEDILLSTWVQICDQWNDRTAFVELMALASRQTGKSYSVDAARSVFGKVSKLPESASMRNEASRFFAGLQKSPFLEKRLIAHNAVYRLLPAEQSKKALESALRAPNAEPEEIKAIRSFIEKLIQKEIDDE